MRRSYTLNISEVETSLGEDHPRSVQVASSFVAAHALESSNVQSQPLLGSRPATGTRHRRKGRLHQGDRSPGLLRHVLKNLFGHSHRPIGGLLGHRGLSKKLGLEIFNRNVAEVAHKQASPLEGAVFPLALSPKVDLGDLLPSLPSSVRSFLGSRQLTLRLLQNLGRVQDLVSTLKVKVWALVGGRNFAHSPIDSYTLKSFGESFVVSTHNERRVPVPFAISGHGASPRFAGQISAPDNRDGEATRETETPLLDSKPRSRVFHRGKSKFLSLELGETFIRLLEELLICDRPISNRLLLRDRSSSPEPIKLSPHICKAFRHPGERWALVLDAFFSQAVGLIPSGNALVPNCSAAIPFLFQPQPYFLAGAKAVVVSNDGLLDWHGIPSSIWPRASQEIFPRSFQGPSGQSLLVSKLLRRLMWRRSSRNC